MEGMTKMMQRLTRPSTSADLSNALTMPCSKPFLTVVRQQLQAPAPVMPLGLPKLRETRYSVETNVRSPGVEATPGQRATIRRRTGSSIPALSARANGRFICYLLGVAETEALALRASALRRGRPYGG